MAAFKANRTLLNVNFEGYKLSETALMQLRVDLPDGVKRKRLKNDCFSYQHMRQATMTNLLFSDPWNKSRVYWISNTSRIMSAFLHPAKDSVNVMSVFDPMSTSTSQGQTSANPSLVFVSPTTALFFIPTSEPNNMFLLNTGCRDDANSVHNWEVINEIIPPIDEFVIECVQASDDALDVIVSALDPQTASAADVNCTLQWFKVNMLSHTPLATPTVTIEWTLTCSSTPLYCELFHDALLVISESDLLESGHSLYEADGDAIGESIAENTGLGYSAPDANYTWSQTDSDVTVTIPLQDDVTKRDVSCVMEKDHLVVGLNDGTTFVRGELFGLIDSEASTWIFEKNKLEVVLEKASCGTEWATLVYRPPTSGSVVTESARPLAGREGFGLTEGERDWLEDRVSKMNNDTKRGSDGPVDSPSKRPKPTIQNTMEECDESGNTQVKCIMVDQDGQISNKTTLGGKELLFILPASQNSPSYVCIKDDVDALVFSLDPSHTSVSTQQWDHTHTFNALGYVQASKRDKKFLTCDSACSYAVLTDCSRHVFVYPQPPDGIKGNRAVQYVHTLGNGEDITGVCAGDHMIFVLSENTLTVLVLI